jgi:hypothetical protein
MRPLLEWCSAVALSRFSIIIPIAIGVVGCSDSSRFSDPFANPYASRGAGPDVTSSVPPAQPAPVGRVDAQPLGAQPMPPPGPAGGPAYYGQRPDSPGMGPPYGSPGPAYTPRASDYPPRDYPPRTADYPPPNYPPRGIGPEYQYPPQAPNYTPQGAGYPPPGAGYPPPGAPYPPQGAGYPSRALGTRRGRRTIPPEGQTIPRGDRIILQGQTRPVPFRPHRAGQPRAQMAMRAAESP